jgi:RNA polymerase sigma-32 factor
MYECQLEIAPEFASVGVLRESAKASDRAMARRVARRSRKIGVEDLLAMYREDYPMVPGSSEADLPEKISELHILPVKQERILARLWKTQGSKTARERLILSIFARQHRHLLKKGNVGEDLLDILQEAVAGTIEYFEQASIERVHAFQTDALLSAVRARCIRHMKMSRPVACSQRIERRVAMGAILHFDLDEVRRGDIPAEIIAEPRGRTARDIDAISDMMAFLSAEDQGVEDIEVPSHEEAVSFKVDADLLEPALNNGLNDRARDIMQRRWLSEDPEDAEDVGRDWNITAERVRQIERQSLKDLRAWIEGGVTSHEVSLRRKALVEHRRENSIPKRLRTNRSSVKGVNLIAARTAFSNMLSSKQAAVLEARYFSTDRVPTYRELEIDLDVSAPRACVLETSALAVLRTRFPAAIETLAN